MIENLIYIILALLGISFLVFIHELGHYWVARRNGITVEAFSIGFGKPIYEWEHDGVKWRICWLLFGGYVKMAGMDKKGSIEPHQIPDGFFGKNPWAQIKVAFAGPLFNIIFALIAFSLVWVLGGRLKPFHDYTNYIGWVNEDSAIYKQGIRPGDQIESLNGRPFNGFNDLIYGAFLDKKTPLITGQEIDYTTGDKRPFQYEFNVTSSVKGLERAISLRQIVGPASYLIYDRLPNGKANPLPEGTPIKESGLSYGDRLLWVDGELVFSRDQLVQVLNEPRALLTVKRGSQSFLTRIPRLKISDLRLSDTEVGELDDWRNEAHLSAKVQGLYFIPYNLTPRAVVENAYGFVDAHSDVKDAFEATPRTYIEVPLQAGDQIVAIDGVPIQSSYELLNALQNRHIQMVVQKMPASPAPSWKSSDQVFADSFDMASLQKIVDSIGSDQSVQEAGNLRLLSPVVPIAAQDFPLTVAERAQNEKKLAEARKKIEEIKDAKQREESLKELEEYQKRLILGVSGQTLQDLSVRYNPSPLVLFSDVVKQTYRTLGSLITGYLSPKYLSGPVGIVQVMQSGFSLGFQEALFWLGMISLNLGIFNLLPIPVLDGGHILLAIVQGITGKPLNAKTRERLMFFFVVLIIAFAIYVTFYDVSRLFS